MPDPTGKREATYPERLYGLEGAEQLESDIATVWESYIDGMYDEGDGPWTLEEWTVVDPAASVPSAVSIVERLEELIANGGEFTEDPWMRGNPSDDAEVVAIAQSLADAIARKVSWFQADRVVGTHVVTVVDGEPQIDGEPMYVTRVSDG